MEDVLLWLTRRGTDEVATQLYQAQAMKGTTATQKLISTLVFANSKSVRTSTIILASFNVVAAFATATSILYDCYCTSRKYSNNEKSKKFFLWAMHPAETFPLVLASGIVVQGIVFAVAQSFGLQALLIDGCNAIAQVVFPAIFLPSYILVVFGVECAIRSLRKEPFQPRGKWDVTICMAVVLAMIIATWIPTQVRKEGDKCFASLMWFVVNFGVLGLVLLCIVAVLLIFSAVTIFYRLSTHKIIDQNQRIAASRMVYYLVLTLVSSTFVMPWFATLAVKDPTLVTSMMATVVLNLTGLMTGVLQLFLRSNTATTSFRPKGTPGWSGKKHEIRMWGPNDLGFCGHMLQPVSGPRSPATPTSIASLVHEKRYMQSPEAEKGPMRSPDRNQLGSPSTPTRLPSRPNQNITPTTSPSKVYRNKPSQAYSIFPSEAPASPSRPHAAPLSTISTTQLPATTFSPAPLFTTQLPATTFSPPSATRRDSAILSPPAALFVPRRHRRDSSMISSATVQIGLRLSHMVDEEPCPLLPDSQKTAAAKPPAKTSYKLPVLQVQTTNLPSPLGGARLSPRERAARMKTLPPVPRVNVDQAADDVLGASKDDEPRLSPTVYKPASSSASKRGLGVEQDPRARASKADWI